MQVILDSSFARPGLAPIWGGKKGEFRDWTMLAYTSDLGSTEPIFYLSVCGQIRLQSRSSNFCKDHRDKIEVPDHLVVEDLISDNLNNRRK